MDVSPEHRLGSHLQSPVMPQWSLSTPVYMRLNGRIYMFVNVCGSATQACKGCMTKIADDFVHRASRQRWATSRRSKEGPSGSVTHGFIGTKAAAFGDTLYRRPALREQLARYFDTHFLGSACGR
jgi:hypothetical protein